MKKQKETIVVICLIVLLILNSIYIYNDAILLYYGVKSFDLPLVYRNILYNSICFFPIILLFQIIRRIFNFNFNKSFIFSMLIYSFLFGFTAYKEKNRKLESYKEYGQMIIPAVVFDKAASSRGGQAGLYVYYYYKGVKETTRVGMNNKKPSFNSIHKGDTVLIMYAVEYRHWNHLYRLHPTPEELNRCRNGCFYFNKQIQDTIPNLPDDPFKLKW